MKYLAQAIITACIMSSAAYAQSDCDAVLAASYDTRYSATDERTYQAAKNRQCSSSAGSSGGSIGYAGFSLGVSQSQLSSWCKDSESMASVERLFKNKVQTVHNETISAWERCIARYGARLAGRYTSDPKIFFVTLGYSSPEFGRAAVLENRTLGNLRCEGFPGDGAKVLGNHTYTCTRDDPYHIATVSVRFQNVNSPKPIEMGALPIPRDQPQARACIPIFKTNTSSLPPPCHTPGFQRAAVPTHKYNDAGLPNLALLIESEAQASSSPHFSNDIGASAV